MPGRPTSGPPYTDPPEEVYVVVTNPWSMNKEPRLRAQDDFNRIASWAQFVLHQAGLGGGRPATIECIYSRGTRDEVIIQFEAGTDIIPLLGEHRWANFVRDWTGSPDDPRSTRVFIYNWTNNGDPATHNWTDNFPSSLPFNGIPAKTPYPPPSWTRPPPSLVNFVHPIPRPPVTPAPDKDAQNAVQEQSIPRLTETSDPPAENEEPPTPQEAESVNLFRPYEPPVQHPSHARFLHQGQVESEEPSPSRTSSPVPKFIRKLDPYELEEDAFNALRSPDPDEDDVRDIKDEEVKTEFKTEDDGVPSVICSGYQPSQALIDALNTLPEATSNRSQTRDPRSTSRSAPSAGSGYRPSAKLETKINNLDAAPPASMGYHPSAKLEAEINKLLLRTMTAASPSSSGDSIRPLHCINVTVKREYEEDVVPPLGERKRIKVEEC